MPTGYTAKLMESGESFENFVLGCARAFGALVTMRDDSPDTPIPEEFKPSDYYERSMAEHRTKLAELNRMSTSDRVAYGEIAKADKLRMLTDWLAKDTAANERLEGMRKEVLAWKPPTFEHHGLKEFMLEQISVSTNSLDYVNREISAAKSKTPLEYWTDAVASEEHGVQWTQKEQAKEIERVAGRNQWVKKLRDSLNTATVPA